MRGDPRDFRVHAPKSLADALSLVASEGKRPLPIAGGTDLMVLLEMGVLEQRELVSIHAIPELRHIGATGNHFRIGACTTFTQIRSNAGLKKEFPLLCEAASQVGALAIQNRATLGGNIANASPAADSSPALLAYDAEIELASSKGTRRVPYTDFHIGYKKTAMRGDELISAILLPRQDSKNERGVYQRFRKVGARAAQAISKVSFAGILRIEDAKVADCRIAMGSVGPVPLRCRAIEECISGKTLDFALIGLAKEKLMQEISPIDDIRSNREYRLRVSLNLLEEFLLTIKHG